MKLKYVKPVFEMIELRVEERLAWCQEWVNNSTPVYPCVYGWTNKS